MSGLNDGLWFFGKSEIPLPRTRQNIDFPKKSKNKLFSVFLYNLEENIPNRQFLIFDFSWILGIFLLSPGISELLKQALKCYIFGDPCSFLSISQLLEYCTIESQLDHSITALELCETRRKNHDETELTCSRACLDTRSRFLCSTVWSSITFQHCNSAKSDGRIGNDSWVTCSILAPAIEWK